MWYSNSIFQSVERSNLMIGGFQTIILISCRCTCGPVFQQTITGAKSIISSRATDRSADLAQSLSRQMKHFKDFWRALTTLWEYLLAFRPLMSKNTEFFKFCGAYISHTRHVIWTAGKRWCYLKICITRLAIFEFEDRLPLVPLVDTLVQKFKKFMVSDCRES